MRTAADAPAADSTAAADQGVRTAADLVAAESLDQSMQTAELHSISPAGTGQE